MERDKRESEVVPMRWTASSEYMDMWADPEDDPRESSRELVGERATLLEYMRIYRMTLEMKCTGLDTEQMARRSVPPSTMSLLGMVRHMAEVERHWFRRVIAAEDAPRIYCTEEDPDGDWNGANPDVGLVEDAWATWREEVEHVEQLVGAAMDLDRRSRTRDGRTISLREVLVHMIEEYARHCGHADLLRERIDGRVGQ